MTSNRKKSVFLSFLALVLTNAFLSCTTSRNPCLEPKVAKLSISCYQFKVDSYIDTALPNANFVSLDIDSARFWYWGANGQSKFDLVLSPLQDSSRWILQADSAFSPIDTLTFFYTRNLKFISNACGYSYDYTISRVVATSRNLDSVKITNNLVTTKAGVENVKIYF
jgi:hypothetical protein